MSKLLGWFVENDKPNFGGGGYVELSWPLLVMSLLLGVMLVGHAIGNDTLGELPFWLGMEFVLMFFLFGLGVLLWGLFKDPPDR